MKENFDVLNFKLTADDMKSINDIDTVTRLFFVHKDPKMVEWFDNIVKERRINNDCRKDKKGS